MVLALVHHRASRPYYQHRRPLDQGPAGGVGRRGCHPLSGKALAAAKSDPRLLGHRLASRPAGAGLGASTAEEGRCPPCCNSIPHVRAFSCSWWMGYPPPFTFVVESATVQAIPMLRRIVNSGVRARLVWVSFGREERLAPPLPWPRGQNPRRSGTLLPTKANPIELRSSLGFRGLASHRSSGRKPSRDFVGSFDVTRSSQ